MIEAYSLFIVYILHQEEERGKMKRSIKTEGTRILEALCVLASFHPATQNWKVSLLPCLNLSSHVSKDKSK